MGTHSSNRHAVFVYGTLMRGERNHHLLSQGLGAKFIRAVRTSGAVFRMNVGESVSSKGKWTPAVFKQAAGGGSHIKGELYFVSDKVLAELDKLEGRGINYDREQVVLENGITAWMYLKKDPSARRYHSPHMRHDNLANVTRWQEKLAR